MTRKNYFKMNKDKKGLMVKFLTTLLLAIIIFAPACIISSKIFRLSDQAEDNFGDFVKAINDLEEGGKKSFMLILDEETAIVGFNQGQALFQSCMKEKELEVCGKWQVPDARECKTGSCVCLIQEIVPIKEKVKQVLPGLREVEYGSAVCKGVDAVFDMPRYVLEKDGQVFRDYFSKDGFVMGRDIPGSEAYVVMKPFDYENRRNLVHLMKKNSNVFVCWEGECQDVNEVVEVEEELPIKY